MTFPARRRLLAGRAAAATLAGGLALSVVTVAAPAALADPAAQPSTAPVAEAAARTVTMTGDRHQGLPGQFESAYSAKTHRLFTTANAWATKAADGSPVNGGGVVAEIDPATMRVTHVGTAPVEVVTGKAAQRHVGLDSAYEAAYPYGIAIDDTRNLIWTTETDAETISAYDQDTLQQVWRSDVGALPHGRDITVLDNGDVIAGGGGGLWRVTGKRGAFSIAKYALNGAGEATTPMSAVAVGGELFVNDLSQPRVRVLDAATGAVKREFPLVAESTGTSRGHLGVDGEVGVVAVVDQGSRDKATGAQVNSGVGFYRTDGTPLGRIKTGTQNLTLTIDKTRHIAYVGDFGGNGEVRAFDLKAAAAGAPAQIGQIATTVLPPKAAGVNYLSMVGDKVFVTTKDTAYKGLKLPYGVDVRTGKPTAITADGDSILMLSAAVADRAYNPAKDVTVAGATAEYDTSTLPIGPVPGGSGSLGTGSLGSGSLQGGSGSAGMAGIQLPTGSLGSLAN